MLQSKLLVVMSGVDPSRYKPRWVDPKRYFKFVYRQLSSSIIIISVQLNILKIVIKFKLFEASKK